ncbi:MAG: hypothetical protein QXU18_13245 [Thermoplasmatales archaeon]
MTKVEVRDYSRQDGTHVRRHVRNDPRAGGSSDEPNPEEYFPAETKVEEEIAGKGGMETTKATEVKTKPKEEKKEVQ